MIVKLYVEVAVEDDCAPSDILQYAKEALDRTFTDVLVELEDE